jgi:hypothetical protein
MSETNWRELNHEIPDGFEKYVIMLCEAGGADNELKVLTRFQKVVRLIHDDKVETLKAQNEKMREAIECIVKNADVHFVSGMNDVGDQAIENARQVLKELGHE